MPPKRILDEKDLCTGSIGGRKIVEVSSRILDYLWTKSPRCRAFWATCLRCFKLARQFPDTRSTRFGGNTTALIVLLASTYSLICNIKESRTTHALEMPEANESALFPLKQTDSLGWRSMDSLSASQLLHQILDTRLDSLDLFAWSCYYACGHQ